MSNARRISRVRLFRCLAISTSPSRPIGNVNSEWMVTPPTFNAATPVGAQTAKDFSVFAVRCESRVDLPVPARPVTKTLLLDCSMYSKRDCCSWLKSIITSACLSFYSDYQAFGCNPQGPGYRCDQMLDLGACALDRQTLTTA